MTDFDALLAELEPMHKAISAPEGDKKVQAAADEAGTEMAPGENEDENENENEDPGEQEAETGGTLGKSFQVTLPDGSVHEAYDGTELLKSFADRLAVTEAGVIERATELDVTRGELEKSLDVASKLLGVVKQQGDLIKSLQQDVARIGAQGAGRKAVVSVSEKQVGNAASQAPQNGNGSVMAKAMSLQKQGVLNSRDIAMLEVGFGRGMPVPAHIQAAIDQAS